MLNIWTVNSGYNFGTIEERTNVNLSLPVSYLNNFGDSTNLSFTVITGSLPPGLRIEGDKIIGSAFEVPRNTEFRFVIRASYNGEIADRTFNMTISGADAPEWATNPGLLPVGSNNLFFILDSSYIEFQLDAVDFDTAAGQELKYFIPSGGGELPPGLILTTDGRIVGFVQPVLAPPLTEGDGSYDNGLFDKVAFDYGVRSSNGFDSFVFDSVFNFDFSTPGAAPKKLNRNFEFTVIVTDGDTSSSRKFRIYVVGDDFLTADNTIMQAGTNTFTADVTDARTPLWITPANLGTYRANNYQTFRLDIYETTDLGPVFYILDAVNPDVRGIAYTFDTSENRLGTNKLRLKEVLGTPLAGHYIQFSDYVDGAPETLFLITDVLKVSNTDYVLTIGGGGIPKTILNDTLLYFGTKSIIPTGMDFDSTTGEIFGVLPYQTAVTKDYRFTVTARRYTDTTETASSKKTFTVKIIGEIDSTITWITPANLGVINANYISILKVEANTTLADSPLLYRITSGALPPGLSLNLDGEITGKVNQFGDNTQSGIITFDNNDFILDAGDTTIDRSYSFTIEARDILVYSASSRTFTLYIDTPNDRLYSNLVVRPFLKQNQRDIFKSFITDPSIFDITSIYRPSDSNFGIQKELKMLIYAGIETRSAAEVVGMAGRNHKPKRFKFGNVKKAVAKEPGTNTVVYEVIYLEVFDPLEIESNYLPSIIYTSKQNRSITVDQNNEFYNGPFDTVNPYWDRPIPLNSTVDRSDIFVGDPQSDIKFPASVSIWRKRIETLGLKERNYMPLWMRSIQEGQVQELGFVKAIPLCYCKSGRADDILLNIKNSDFDFSQIDYVIDRYIIDSVTGYGDDKYIVFRNDRTTIA
jgi:hypothetical protein